jgi:hypothetical protein
MRFDQGVVIVEADDLSIGAGDYVRPHVPMEHRIERVRDDHQLITADFGRIHSGMS